MKNCCEDIEHCEKAHIVNTVSRINTSIQYAYRISSPTLFNVSTTTTRIHYFKIGLPPPRATGGPGRMLSLLCDIKSAYFAPGHPAIPTTDAPCSPREKNENNNSWKYTTRGFRPKLQPQYIFFYGQGFFLRCVLVSGCITRLRLSDLTSSLCSPPCLRYHLRSTVFIHNIPLYRTNVPGRCHMF